VTSRNAKSYPFWISPAIPHHPNLAPRLTRTGSSTPFKPIRAHPTLPRAEYLLQSRANKEFASGTLGKDTQAPSGRKRRESEQNERQIPSAFLSEQNRTACPLVDNPLAQQTPVPSRI